MADAHFISAPQHLNHTDMRRDFNRFAIYNADIFNSFTFATATLSAHQTAELQNLGYKVVLNDGHMTPLNNRR